LEKIKFSNSKNEFDNDQRGTNMVRKEYCSIGFTLSRNEFSLQFKHLVPVLSMRKKTTFVRFKEAEKKTGSNREARINRKF
jgi:hypothetical protein